MPISLSENPGSLSENPGTPVFAKLAPHMAMAVEGVDLREPPEPILFARLRQALLDHQVLCIRGQDIGPAEFLATMRLFGEPEIRPYIPHVEGFPAVTTISSGDRDTEGDGKRLVAGATWHTDDSFRSAPSALTALYGVEVPETGGDTEFANLYDAYAALPDDMKQRLAGLKAVHMMKPDRDGHPHQVQPQHSMVLCWLARQPEPPRTGRPCRTRATSIHPQTT